MLRFTLRDMLWLTALVAIGIAWWLEQRTTVAMKQERDEAVALWHDASAKWVAATSRIPPGQRSIGGEFYTPITPQSGATGGGLGGVLAPTPTNRPSVSGKPPITSPAE